MKFQPGIYFWLLTSCLENYVVYEIVYSIFTLSLVYGIKGHVLLCRHLEWKTLGMVLQNLSVQFHMKFPVVQSEAIPKSWWCFSEWVIRN